MTADHAVPPLLPVSFSAQAIAEVLGFDGRAPDTWPFDRIESLQTYIVRHAEVLLRQELYFMTRAPKPKFRWIDGVKVYETYADYCND